MAAYASGRLVVCVVAAAALGSPPATAASAQHHTLLEACWAPSALPAKTGEKSSRRPDRRFDAAPEEMALAPFAPDTAASQGVIRRVDLATDRKLIALTFDLCEQRGEVAGYDGAIVEYLRKERVKATFFAGGKWLRSHEERARQLMADPLFEIGNHAEAHRNLRLLNGQRLVAEIVGPQRAYEAIRARFAQSQCVKTSSGAIDALPARITLFRFPYGACNPRALQAVSDHGLRAIQWDLSTGDAWPKQSAARIARALLAQARPGSIVLAHANGRGWHTAAALALVIPKLRQMGFEFVTVSELLAAGKPVVSTTCYDSRPGDTDHYDHPKKPRQEPPPAQSFFPFLYP